MEIKLGMLLACVLATGCAAIGGPNGAAVPASASNAAGASPFPAPDPFPSMQQPDGIPRIVIPATGGAPVIGIPLGGNIFQPVTGGAPVIGIPTSP